MDRTEREVEDVTDRGRRNGVRPRAVATVGGRRLRQRDDDTGAAGREAALLQRPVQLLRLRGELPLLREVAEEVAEQAAVRLCRDREVDLVEVHHRPEQVQIERTQNQV